MKYWLLSLKFQNRIDAGVALAKKLMNYGYNSGPTIVLGIPRGGVILADIIAKILSADFDIVIPRKLGAPDNEELAIGAVMEDGTSYINRYIVNALRIPSEYIEKEKARQITEIKRRSAAYRRREINYKINSKRAILVDDGIATGATVIASARWLRKQNPSSVVAAVPVAPLQSTELLEQEVDSVLVLQTPREFGSVGQFYEEFDAISDQQVIQIMNARSLL
jgi:putative phosphoribosyl transferase